MEIDHEEIKKLTPKQKAEGIYFLTKSSVQARKLSYRFERDGNTTRARELMNASINDMNLRNAIKDSI